MKKSILVLAVFLFPALVFAQTPSLYDEWSPMLFGTKAHFVITRDQIILTFPQDAESAAGPLAAFLTAPAMPSPASSKIDVKSDPVAARTTKVKLLKVVYDSAQAKGRFFVSIETKYDTNILPFRFVLKDNGEAEVGLAANPLNFLEGGKKTLKQIEKESAPSAKKTLKKSSHSSNFEYDFVNILSDLSFTFYNKARTEGFAKMKDPAAMPKEEMIGMMNSFGDRIAAELQNMPQDTSSDSFKEFKLFGPMIKTVPRIIHDLFIAHGYNPLGMASCIERFKGDSDIMAAGNVFSDKIEESVPALRAAKARREANKVQRDSNYIAERNKVFEKAAKDEKEFQEDQKEYKTRHKEIEPAELPKPFQVISVDYPADAKSAGIEGKVNFSALVGKDGKVIKVTINKSDNKLFNQAVIDAVKNTQFTPAKLRNGEVTKVWYSQTINFRLNQDTAVPEEH